MVVPFNSLATWIITGLSIVTILITFGYNPQPLLALGSVSGIVVGFASQEILLNLFRLASAQTVRLTELIQFMVLARSGAAV